MTKSFESCVVITDNTFDKFRNSISKDKKVEVRENKKINKVTSHSEALSALGILKNSRKDKSV